MTWTYGGDPSEPKDEVRLLVGDTTETDQMTQDEEIEYALELWPPGDGKPAWLASAYICDAIAGRFARQMQQSIGPLAKSAQMMWEHYRQQAQDYRVLYATNGLGIVDGSMAGVKAAAPYLSGGGQTYLGPTTDPYTGTEVR